jgi:hypothetical protein
MTERRILGTKMIELIVFLHVYHKINKRDPQIKKSFSYKTPKEIMLLDDLLFMYKSLFMIMWVNTYSLSFPRII